MARPVVPHCKDCSSCHGYKFSYWRCLKTGKFIDGQEIRTSPLWCPLRPKWRMNPYCRSYK